MYTLNPLPNKCTRNQCCLTKQQTNVQSNKKHDYRHSRVSTIHSIARNIENTSQRIMTIIHDKTRTTTAILKKTCRKHAYPQQRDTSVLHQIFLQVKVFYKRRME